MLVCRVKQAGRASRKRTARPSHLQKIARKKTIRAKSVEGTSCHYSKPKPGKMSQEKGARKRSPVHRIDSGVISTTYLDGWLNPNPDPNNNNKRIRSCKNEADDAAISTDPPGSSIRHGDEEEMVGTPLPIPKTQRSAVIEDGERKQVIAKQERVKVKEEKGATRNSFPTTTTTTTATKVVAVQGPVPFVTVPCLAITGGCGGAAAPITSALQASGQVPGKPLMDLHLRIWMKVGRGSTLTLGMLTVSTAATLEGYEDNIALPTNKIIKQHSDNVSSGTRRWFYPSAQVKAKPFEFPPIVPPKHHYDVSRISGAFGLHIQLQHVQGPKLDVLLHDAKGLASSLFTPSVHGPRTYIVVDKDRRTEELFVHPRYAPGGCRSISGLPLRKLYPTTMVLVPHTSSSPS